MVNLYAYTYESAATKFPGYILVKVGDTRRAVEERLEEQGDAAEFEAKIKVGEWYNLKNITRDKVLHRHRDLAQYHYKKGRGTEWFRIKADSIEEAHDFIDNLVTQLEGKKIRKSVKLRAAQQKALETLLAIIDRCAKSGKSEVNVIANLCPRFGKTIWALAAFNELSKQYGTSTLFLPSYWLSSQTSFEKELDQFEDFVDIVHIKANDPEALEKYRRVRAAGGRVCVTLSLHGDLETWCKTHAWMREIPLNEVFNFVDEGDFGAHTPNQKEKLAFLFG